MQSHCVDCVLQYNGNLWHKLLAKSWVMHYSPIMVLFSSVLFPFTSCIFASSYQYISGLVLSGNFWFVLLLSSLGCNTHVHMEKYMCSYPPPLTPPPPHAHTDAHTHMHRESPLVLFLTLLCTAATFYWWLTTATSKVSLSFDSLICISSPSQHDSAYLCPQAECQCLFSAYKYPPILYVMYTPGHF